MTDKETLEMILAEMHADCGGKGKIAGWVQRIGRASERELPPAAREQPGRDGAKHTPVAWFYADEINDRRRNRPELHFYKDLIPARGHEVIWLFAGIYEQPPDWVARWFRGDVR